MHDHESGCIATICFALLVGSIAAFIFVVVDSFTITSSPQNAVVLGHNYTPPSTSVGSGISADGKTTVVVTSESAKWVIIAQTNSITVPVRVSEDQWSKCQKGQQIKIVKEIGRISKSIYYYKIKE